jgi:hypothetical protein
MNPSMIPECGAAVEARGAIGALKRFVHLTPSTTAAAATTNASPGMRILPMIQKVCFGAKDG